MKRILKQTLLIMVLVFSIYLIGCNKTEQGKYNGSIYDLNIKPELNVEITYSEAKEALDVANSYFKNAKSYSYTQEVTGEYDSQYSYTGTTKIDVSKDVPMASLELVGTTNYAFYIVGNKAYLNYNGEKIAYETDKTILELIESMQSSTGTFTSFDFSNISENDIEYMGKDKNQVTVIKFNDGYESSTMIVIYENKIMKVMYSNDDAVYYTINYDYNAITVELPQDLDTYKHQ